MSRTENRWINTRTDLCQTKYCTGEIDYRLMERDGKPAVEFSWEGMDAADGTPVFGRGWAGLEGEELKGMIYFHLGDETDFVAKPKPANRSKRKRK